MWIFTTVGFFSAVQKPGTDGLTVRARARADLDRLRESYMPELSATTEKGGTDYPFRATIGHSDFAFGLARIARDVTYDNFKNAVAKRQGHARAKTYGKVWSALLDLEQEECVPQVPKARSSSKPIAYGGVVVDADGRVLLREPRNHYGGYVWTFAKGRPDPGETPEECALREVREEMGLEARVVERIPGEFAGDTSDTVFYLMEPAGELREPDRETNRVKWCSVEEAQDLVQKTRSAKGRTRDLAVLEATRAVLARS